MFDRCFIDLDDTLYDTRQFKEDIYSVFKPYGIKRVDFISAYRKAAELPRLGYFHYTFDKQIEAVRELGFDIPDSVLSELETLLNKNYIIPDAEEFVKFLRTCVKRIILLTAGTKEFQAKKIDAIQVRKLVDEIVQIEGGKDDILRPFVEANNLLFINDNLDENMLIKKSFPSVTVLTIFNPSYWSEDDCEKSGIPWFRSLLSIKNYLNVNSANLI